MTKHLSYQLRVGGIQIKENTAVRKMEFTPNDLAYTCDIDALHKKIDTLHEQIEKNDTILATTKNEFPAVDEVNKALDELKNNMVNMDNLCTKEEADNKSMVYDIQQYLEDNYMSWDQVLACYYDKNDCDSKFVLKTQITELQNKITTLESRLAALEQNKNQDSVAGDLSSYATKAELSQYRKLNDLYVSNQQVLPIINQQFLLDDGDEPISFITAHIPYHE